MAASYIIPALLIAGFLLQHHASMVVAVDLYFDWTVAYARRSPLGVPKEVITINGQFPGPLVNATTNDVLRVNVVNKLDEPFLLTWNGVQMRRNSWNDGVQGTNCPIPVGRNWTYEFQVKDQIGSFFYFPSLSFQKAAGGYGPLRVNNRIVIPIPFDQPRGDFDILVGDWYNAGHKELRSTLDKGRALAAHPDGILINGMGPMGASFIFQPGATYRLRISNVGLKASINFRIEGHRMQLVEAEGSYVLPDKYKDLDIHVGQSYSVLVTADRPAGAYYVVATTRFLDRVVNGTAVVHYDGEWQAPTGSPPRGPSNLDYAYSLNQARSMRWHLSVGAARPNPQGSFHYGLIPISRTIVLENGKVVIGGKTRYAVNDISFAYPETPLKLADYLAISNAFGRGRVFPSGSGAATLGSPVIDAQYRDFVQIVFQNPCSELQSWHVDGYNFFVVGNLLRMESGKWDEGKSKNYNLIDALSRSTIQVYPKSWTAILLELDNYGMWNIRSQDEEMRYLGQELYMRVKGPLRVPNVRDELPIPANALKCGLAA